MALIQIDLDKALKVIKKQGYYIKRFEQRQHTLEQVYLSFTRLVKRLQENHQGSILFPTDVRNGTQVLGVFCSYSHGFAEGGEYVVAIFSASLAGASDPRQSLLQKIRGIWRALKEKFRPVNELRDAILASANSQNIYYVKRPRGMITFISRAVKVSELLKLYRLRRELRVVSENDFYTALRYGGITVWLREILQ